jgi:hypothetical protein
MERGHIIDMLFAEFPTEVIRWRAQTVKKDGNAALALAYIDSRDVQDRLDQVCGVDGWQDSYHDVGGGRTSCTISIKFGGEWISKSDGAGVTQVEAEKGLFSDAFKRAAVKWGIGRYLYDVKNVWVPCETYDYNGKKKFSKFTAKPLEYCSMLKNPVTRLVSSGHLTVTELKAKMRELNTEITGCGDIPQLEGMLEGYRHVLNQCIMDLESWHKAMMDNIDKRKTELKDK